MHREDVSPAPLALQANMPANFISPPCGQYSRGTVRLVDRTHSENPFQGLRVREASSSCKFAPALVNHFVVFFWAYYKSTGRRRTRSRTPSSAGHRPHRRRSRPAARQADTGGTTAWHKAPTGLRPKSRHSGNPPTSYLQRARRGAITRVANIRRQPTPETAPFRHATSASTAAGPMPEASPWIASSVQVLQHSLAIMNSKP